MENAISSDLIRGHIDAIILNTLLDGDKFAQQISESVDGKSENKYKINQATLYSSLKRLENLAYIKSYWNDALDGRRKFFKITDLGKTFIENNLAEWSFSREIIDKLINSKYEPQIKTVYIEKNNRELTAQPLQSPIIDSTPEIKEQSVTKKQEEKENFVSENEINFRNVLNCLVKSSEKDRKNTEKPLNNDVKTEEIQQIATFNDTIKATPESHTFNSKMEFEDLTKDAKENGYKIRIATKREPKKGKLLINKLNFFSALIVVLLGALEILAISLTYGESFERLNKFIIIASIVCLIYPIISLFIEMFNSKKTVIGVNNDSIGVCLICIFNIILIDFALTMLFNLNFSDTKSVILFIVSPIALSINAFVFFVFRRLFSKFKFFKMK